MNDACENRDPMTGLWNPKYFYERLESIVGQCAQVALILIDIDRLHPFNYQLGYMLGDEKIVEVAREIEALSGNDSEVFRCGGDEFSVILPEASLKKARELAEVIRAQRKPIL